MVLFSQTKEPAGIGQSREQYGFEGSKENSDALFDEIGCLTDLQKSLSAAIGPTRNRELLGWIILNELQASRNILQYQKVLICLLSRINSAASLIFRNVLLLF